MMRHIFPAIAAFALTLIMPSLVKADEVVSPEMATLVVYRADESFKTDKLRFDLHADQYFIGRAKADGLLQLEAPAGSYTLDTSMPGAETLTLDLKPGAVHYVHSKLVLRGNRVELELIEVEEQVARNHAADGLAGTI